MLEKIIEKRVCDYATDKGVMVRKNEVRTFIGRPDRVFHYKGLTWYIEFKAQGKKASPAQLREIQKLTDQGIPAYVVDNIEDGKTIVDRFVNFC